MSEQKRRALLSAYDKTGMVELGRALVELGWELVSSGGTARVLADAGLPVIPTEQVTGFPEMLGHRVVTLHPSIHGGILADRDDPSHVEDMATYDVDADRPGGRQPVPVHLGPVDRAHRHRRSGHGPRRGQEPPVRDGAGRTRPTTTWCSASSGADGDVSAATRRRLARDAFAHTAAYDAAIVGWFDGGGAGEMAHEGPLPPTIHISATLAQPLRYGENPHQVGARYSFTGDSCWDTAVQHGGKEMSYLNVYDADAAWRLVWSLGDLPSAVVIKHANPCGAAVASDITTAYTRAHAV